MMTDWTTNNPDSIRRIFITATGISGLNVKRAGLMTGYKGAGEIKIIILLTVIATVSTSVMACDNYSKFPQLSFFGAFGVLRCEDEDLVYQPDKRGIKIIGLNDKYSATPVVKDSRSCGMVYDVSSLATMRGGNDDYDRMYAQKIWTDRSGYSYTHVYMSKVKLKMVEWLFCCILSGVGRKQTTFDWSGKDRYYTCDNSQHVGDEGEYESSINYRQTFDLPYIIDSKTGTDQYVDNIFGREYGCFLTTVGMEYRF